MQHLQRRATAVTPHYSLGKQQQDEVLGDPEWVWKSLRTLCTSQQCCRNPQGGRAGMSTASKAAGDVLPAAGRSRIYAAWTVFSFTLNSSIFIHGIFNVQLREPLRELSDGEHHRLPYGKAKKTTLIKWNTEILLLLSILFQVKPKCCIPHGATPATQKLSLEEPVGAEFSEQAFLRQKTVSMTPLRLQVAPLKHDWLPFYPVVQLLVCGVLGVSS